MIEKKIYYCWFGNAKKSKLIKNCIKSWYKYCEGYEIIEINESNFDISQNKFCAQAYKEKKYAYVADYARTKTIYENGGIYLDCDVELLKPLNKFLEHTVFIGVEKYDLLESYLFGAVKFSPYIKAVLSTFEDEEFCLSNGEYNFHTMPQRFSECFREMYSVAQIDDTTYELQDIIVYPQRYFQPIDFKTEELVLTKDTYAIHHYAASWYSPSKRFAKKCEKLLPRFLRRWIRKIIGKERD